MALMQELQGLCPHHPALTSLDHLSPGQPCCVQFREDSLWYRASVLEVDEETAKVRAAFVMCSEHLWWKCLHRNEERAPKDVIQS